MIGILIISHGNLGDSLIHCANHVLGARSPHLADFSITIRDDPDAAAGKARELIKQLDQGEGVLILCDICGATPCNVASRLINPGRVECLAGVNLPMLVRALTYRTEPLPVATGKALVGGRDGVIQLSSSTA
jgi:PTS system ascorbate-specific IIA component